MLEKQRSEKAALLGAMLQVRKNDTLEKRVGKILEDISTKPNAEHVIEAYACIAAMHAEGFKFLKQQVLAETIKYDLRKLRSDILDKLGEEIVASNQDCPIFTRHQIIAETAVKILSESPYYKDFENDIYPLLAESAERLWEKGSIGDGEIMKWRYDFPKYFADNIVNPRISLAINIAEAVYKIEKSPQLFTHLAQLYRKGSRLKTIIKLFRESSFTQSETDRRFYSEWATTERDAENYAIAIWLYAIALADSTPPLSPTLENAMVYLSNMGFGFYCLCKLKQPFDIYAKALGASEQLARSISGLVEYPNKGDNNQRFAQK
ncbi:MAG: hypothetical protein HC903_32065 [Methylacidiphilales bacterium]|nr:hypothetical protein [Candidatus Methylacidiphilales bacterium]